MRRSLLVVGAAGLAAVAVVLPGLAGDTPAPPVRPVTDVEARAAVQRVVDLTARGRFAQACPPEGHGCASSRGGEASVYAPGADRAPSVLCTFALPTHLRGKAWGDGHVVVLQGRDARDRPYVSQQLVLRVGEQVQVHEPAFWRGIAYNGFGGVRGSVWASAYGEGPTDAAFTALQTERAVRSCQDTAGYLAEVVPGSSPSPSTLA